MKVYVASSLFNIKRTRQIMEKLKNDGFQITYDWTVHGKVDNEDECRNIAILEEQGVLCCDVFILVFPGRTGSHIEFGLARASNKIIILLQEIETERKTFYYLPGIVRIKTEEELFSYLQQLKKGINNVE